MAGRLSFLSHVVQVNIPAARSLGSFHSHNSLLILCVQPKEKTNKNSRLPNWPQYQDLMTYEVWPQLRFRVLWLLPLPSHPSKQVKQHSCLHFTRSLCKEKHRGRTETFCLEAKTLQPPLQTQPTRLSKKRLPQLPARCYNMGSQAQLLCMKQKCSGSWDGKAILGEPVLHFQNSNSECLIHSAHLCYGAKRNLSFCLYGKIKEYRFIF